MFKRLLLTMGLLGSLACHSVGVNTERNYPTVTIDNESWEIVTIYAMRYSNHIRIGQLTPYSKATFTIRDDELVNGEMAPYLQTLGARNNGWQMEPMPVRDGFHLELVIMNHLPNSYISIEHM